jgi:hypothetical protein
MTLPCHTSTEKKASLVSRFTLKKEGNCHFKTRGKLMAHYDYGEFGCQPEDEFEVLADAVFVVIEGVILDKRGK